MKQYLYIYLDPRKRGNFQYSEIDLCFLCEPFYVGRGTRSNRKFSHLQEAYTTNKNSHKCNTIRKIKKELGVEPIILVLYGNLNEKEVNELEIKFIECIGRSDLKTGPLTNLTCGGEGIVGRIMTEECKLKNSLAHRGPKHPRYGLKGKDNPLYGIKHKDSHKRKIGLSNAEYNYRIEDERGNIYYTDSLKSFSIRNNLNQSSMNKVANGIYPNYKGWKIFKIDRIKQTKRDSVSQETRAKMSSSKKKFIYEAISPNGEKYSDINNLKEFSFEHNFNLKSLYNHIRLGANYKGWIFKKYQRERNE